MYNRGLCAESSYTYIRRVAASSNRRRKERSYESNYSYDTSSKPVEEKPQVQPEEYKCNTIKSEEPKKEDDIKPMRYVITYF